VSEQPQMPRGDKGHKDELGTIRALAFFTADYVAHESGKLYVNGGFFNMIRYPVFPAVIPTLGIGASLHVPWHAYQQDHHFTITMQDEDRRELPLRVEGMFRVGADILLRHGDPSVINVAGNVTNLVIERPGHFTLVLHVDDKHLADWTLQAVQLPAGFPTTAAPPAPQE
jgi:hypothetical protein